MTKMKPRRIGSAFIDLDPLDVIKEKDRTSRKTSLAKRNGDHVNGGTQSNPAAGPTMPGEQQCKNSKTIYNDKPTVSVTSQDNLLGSARVDHVADATKHAISKTQQPGKVNASHSSPGAAKAKENPTLISPKLNVEATSTVEATVDDTAPATTKPANRAEKTQHGSTFVSSRPKRVARKRYAEVDWYEDLRPTDDESPNAENGTEKSSVSSPEPEHTDSPSKPSHPKRKIRQSAPNSSKRRKGTKGKGKNSDKEAQKLQLPLTAAPTSLVDSPGANANPTSKKSDMQAEKAKRTTKDFVNSSPPKAPEQDPKENQNGAAHLEIIEISSTSPLSTNESDSDHDMDEATTHMNQTAEAEPHGRGKSVGQKLSDALRDAGLTTQRLPVINIGSNLTLTHTSKWAPMFERSCSPVSCASSSQYSMEQGALGTDFDLAQVQSNPALIQQEGSEPIEATTVSLDIVPEACLVTSSPVRGTAACTHKSPSQQPRSLRELSSQASVDMGNDKDVVDSQWMTLRDHSEAVPSTEFSRSDSRHSIPSHAEDSRAIIRNQESEIEGSSRSSAAAITDVPTALLPEGSGDEHTPESQQPLLTKETPRRPMPMSIPRSSIVDDNGSPRLIERGRAGSLRFGRLLSLATTDSSQSSHERASVDCSDEYTPHDRPSLSKFHLDMLLEYGIEAEDLFKRRRRSTLFRSHTTSGGTSIRASRCMGQRSETRLTTVSRQSDDSNAVEKGTSVSEQGKAPAAGPSSSQRTIDEMGLCTNRSSGGDRLTGKLLSTEITSQFQPSPELPRPIMQDDTDGMAWISALQTAQRSAHSLLKQTNQNLSVQLAAEQDTIRQVLQIYRQGCNRILDDLFRAQEARMELYRQQMSSVKKQHTQICQELIRGLQDLDHRVQQGA